jgi:hypothetical protein
MAAGLVAAVAVAASDGLVLGFGDAPSHVILPRRVLDSVDPSLAQLGTHWAPLFHVLQIPIVWIEPLYRGGGSGTIVSAVASLVTGLYLYRLARLLDCGRPAAFVAVAVLAASPSFLYAGVVPMQPALIMATTTANVYYLTRWALTGSGASLLAAGVALTLATLTHFDTWILAPLELVVVIAVARGGAPSRFRVEATTLLWLLASGYGVFLFLLMNLMIYGDPFHFPALLETPRDRVGPREGLIPIESTEALLHYPRAAWHTAGPVLALAGVLGIALFVWRWRRSPHRLIPLLLLYPFAFYTFQAATSGSWIVPAERLGDWENLRYALTILPALAFFTAAGIRRAIPLAIATLAIVASAAVMVASERVASWEEAKVEGESRKDLVHAAEWLGARAPGGRVLIPVPDRSIDRFELKSGLPARAFVDPTATDAWRAALAEPASVRGSGIRWVVTFVHAPEGRPHPHKAQDEKAEVNATHRATFLRILRETGARLCYTKRSPVNPTVRIYSLGRDCGPSEGPRNRASAAVL